MEKTSNFNKIVKYAEAIIELKVAELKSKLVTIKTADFLDYLFNITLKNVKIVDVSDITYYVFNVKINKLIEYITSKGMLEKSNLQQDLDFIVKS